jgi:hypothetical protein
MRTKRQNIIFASLFALILIVVAFVYSKKDDVRNAESKNPVQITENIATSTDGMAWQKQFIDKNINISKSSSEAKNTSNKSTKSNPTATDLFGMDFLSKYSELRQSGLNTNADAVKGATNSILANAQDYLPKPKLYTYDDLKILEDKSTSVLVDYGKQVVSATAKLLVKENETTIVADAFDKNDMTLLKKIDPVIASYKRGLNDLVAMKVPSPLAKYHLDLVNGASMQVYNAESLRNTDTDPVRGLAGISMEVTALSQINTAILSIEKYLNDSGIVFATNK